jgi:hypothetical protein
MSDLLQLRERKRVQWALAYVAFAFALLQGLISRVASISCLSFQPLLDCAGGMPGRTAKLARCRYAAACSGLGLTHVARTYFRGTNVAVR